jgi:deazaflavin-dependent oxidoreductase (nitroreductase family)
MNTIDVSARPPKKPPAWFVHTAWKAHRALHRVSGGRFLWTTSNKRGWGAMHLTTTGRRSGQPRSVIVGYLEDGANLVVMAMNGWDEGHPSWWLNLQADPVGTVQLTKEAPRQVRAREATDDERDRLWHRWVEVDPKLTAHAPHRSTPTPMVVLEPTN